VAIRNRAIRIGALDTIRAAAERAGIAAGIHCPSGEAAATRLDEGYTFATISSDLTHLQAVAAAHLAAADEKGRG
jgi:4-hydroxy-2-oxoheptanedioate aldolase